MSTPVEHSLTVRIGDTETLNLSFQNEDGSAIDLTGRTYAAQVRSKASSASPLATFSCTLTDAANGKLACTLSATSTAALSPGNAVWDLQETFGTTVKTLMAGSVRIEQDVTR